ncbi:MAG: efflux RND transporter periplasmic adaptor subunit [Acidobacteria bacterium]|nr:MAG: efflux RND transporter periplasmic adaptor subunit [Acidobacteriota bacterium]
MGTPTRLAAHDLATLKIEEPLRAAGKAGRRLGLSAAGLGAVVVIGGLVVALRSQQPQVEVAPARPAGDPRASALLNASGYVTPRRRSTIAAKITGRVTAVYAEEGIRVNAGQILARLDGSDARVRLVAAKAERDATAASIKDLEVNLANAERELQRAKDLQAAGIQTVQALDQARTTVESLRARIALARAQVRAAEARITVAEQDVENATIRAPFGGLVVSKDAQVGEMVSPISAGGGFTRTGIATVVDMNSLEVEVDVNESYISRARPGQKVIATLDAYPDWQIPAKVRTIIPTADRQKATVKVRIAFDKLDPRILPDMGVKVAFLSEEDPGSRNRANKARALIPRGAVREENGKQVVFLVREAKLERRAVSLGAERGSDVEVIAGVSPGDKLVVRGPQMLREGQAVEIKQ